MTTSEFAAADLKTVGNYTLGKLIGKGSFGKVYLASHKLSNGSKVRRDPPPFLMSRYTVVLIEWEQVVLKSAKKNDANLAREIHHHRQFIHPHIARLYEVLVTEELVWLALEWCPGDELYNYLLNKGALEPAKVQRIFTQLVGAVSYVHSKSCVHRDLKLENILLDKHGDVKLVDFGFTREYEGKSNYLQTWCGTVCYSAPEMLKGEKYAGEKVDVWSLGIILYALLVGELPFDDDDEMVTKSKILREDPKYPDNFPPQARELCQALLSKRPILRPTLAEILQNPWLAEHAPRQQETLKLQQPAPFSTELEKEVLHRMRAAGVDIDMVIENVLAQRCDSLAGWWALLLEKEERKAKRRERKRKEREAEAKSLRRLSAASSALDKMAPTIKELEEGGLPSSGLNGTPKSRGRTLNRKSMHGECLLLKQRSCPDIVQLLRISHNYQKRYRRPIWPAKSLYHRSDPSHAAAQTHPHDPLRQPKTWTGGDHAVPCCKPCRTTPTCSTPTASCPRAAESSPSSTTSSRSATGSKRRPNVPARPTQKQAAATPRSSPEANPQTPNAA